MIGLVLGLLLAGNVSAQTLSIGGPFSGLNNTDASITLDPSQAQDLLNVEISKDGLAINKREGYSLYETLGITTASVNGAISFRDSSGNNIHLIASDRTIYTSINGGVYSALLSTMPAGAKWDFCASDGSVFAFNDSHDTPWSWDGTTITYYPSMPKGSMCAMTTTRMLVAGTTDYPNRLYFSAAGDYTNFTVDIDVDSPSFDDVGLAGDKITAIYATGSEWLIFKTNSFTSYQGTNQYDLTASVVSSRVGMSDPQAIVDHEGVVYFKGTDNKIWAYNSGVIVDASQKISGTTENISPTSSVVTRKYTTESDFNQGTFFNTTSSGTYGSIEPLTFSYQDTTDADFNAGTTDPALKITNDSIYITSLGQTPDLGGYFRNMGAEQGDTSNWQDSLENWTASATSYDGQSPVYGDRLFYKDTNGYTSVSFGIYKNSTDELVYSNSFSFGNGSYNNKDLTIDMSSYENTDYNIQIRYGASISPSFIRSTPFTKGTIYVNLKAKYSPPYTYIIYDMQETPPAASSGTFISQLHHVTADTPFYGTMVETSSITAGSSINYYIAFATASTGSLSVWQSTSSVWCSTCPYYKWKSEIAATTNTISSPYISDVSLNFKTTGYWLSDEVNIGGMSTWGTFLADKTTTGTGAWTYTIAVSTYSGGTDSAVYESLTSGSAITASTGTHVRLKAADTLSCATETVRTDSLKYARNFATDSQSAAFEYLGDIYFSVPYNFSTTNNRVLKLDTKRMGWSIFDIPMNYPVTISDSVWFGSPTGGYVYTYPYGNSDNGAAINSYWKTKDFIGSNPYTEKEFQRLSVIAGASGGSSLTATYTIDTANSTSYNIALTSTTANFVRNNRALELGGTGQFFNLNVGNNAADQPWSFYGASVDYVEKPWRVTE